MNRRSSFAPIAALALTSLSLVTRSGRALAQRPSPPIERPGRGGRDRPVVPGRFYGSNNYGAAPGVFVVAAVKARDGLLQLRDRDGQVGEAYVSPRLFDIETLKVGDEVAVDFYVAGDNDARLEVASLFKIEP